MELRGRNGKIWRRESEFDFPGGSDGKESACNAGDWGSIAGGWEDPLEKREAGGTVDLAKTLGRSGEGNFLLFSTSESPGLTLWTQKSHYIKINI